MKELVEDLKQYGREYADSIGLFSRVTVSKEYQPDGRIIPGLEVQLFCEPTKFFGLSFFSFEEIEKCGKKPDPKGAARVALADNIRAVKAEMDRASSYVKVRYVAEYKGQTSEGQALDNA